MARARLRNNNKKETWFMKTRNEIMIGSMQILLHICILQASGVNQISIPVQSQTRFDKFIEYTTDIT